MRRLRRGPGSGFLFLLGILVSASVEAAAPARPVVQRLSVMAPLYIGDPELSLDHPDNQQAWDEFRQGARLLRSVGVQSIAVDVWWGLVQRYGRQTFQWDYYDRFERILREEGLAMSVVLSTHACGDNVGDDVFIPIPDWVRQGDPETLFYKSELGNFNYETLSPWADPKAVPLYEEFWGGFVERYVAKKDTLVSGVALSAGSAGEARAPSYNAHDRGHPHVSYPGRGVLQTFSEPAIHDFKRYLKDRFTNSIDQLNAFLGTAFVDFEAAFAAIFPMPSAGPTAPSVPTFSIPTFSIPTFIDAKIAGGWLTTKEADLFFDWNRSTVIAHVQRLLDGFERVRQQHVPNRDHHELPVAIKVAGIHWGEAHRFPELAAGLLSTSDRASWFDTEQGFGYGPLVRGFADRCELRDGPLKLSLTCIAMEDRSVSPTSHAGSLSRGFFRAVDQVAVRKGGENALGEELGLMSAQEILMRHVTESEIQAITLLRFEDMLGDDVKGARRKKVLSHPRGRNDAALGLCARLLALPGSRAKT